MTPRERDMRQQQIERDETYQEQRYGSRSSRDFRKGYRSDVRVNGRVRNEGLSTRDDFRVGRPSSMNSRSMQRNQNVRGEDEYYDYYGEDDNDEYYMDDFRYEGRKRSINSDRYGNDEYYDPEIIGRDDRERNEKRSVWDNIRDVFKF